MITQSGSAPHNFRALQIAWQFRHRVDWCRLIFTGGIPLVAFVAGILWVPLKFQTAVFTAIFGVCSSISITAGYHRLWAHRAYSAHPALQIFLAILGASAGQGCIRTWCRDHRAHHRYVDSDRDPYSVHKGLFYAHYGWVILKRERGTIGYVDIQDMSKDTIVMWQRENYMTLLFLTAYAFPIMVSGLLFDDFGGGLIYASCLRLLVIQQSTSCVNSLAHWIGEKPFSGQHSPRDNLLVALITYGEGYHNFHHEFPMDYRNGVRWIDYDPTKWFIWICSCINLASNLKRFPKNEIEKSRVQQLERQLENRRLMISWGTPPDELPSISIAQYTDLLENGRFLITIDDVVHDVSNFMGDHPGGAAQLERNIGKDCTKLFHGGMYAHSNAAINLLSTLRIARIEDIPRSLQTIKSGSGNIDSD